MIKPDQRGRLRNPGTRYVLFEYLALRDGRKCRICGTPDSEVELIIDHIDRNTLNWALVNLRLLCRSCNVPQAIDPIDPIGGTPQSVSECERVLVRGERGLELREASSEIRLNRVSEPLFRRWLMGRLYGEGRVLLGDVINGGAEECNISPMTARRYLAKMLSSVGSLFVYEKNWVMMKPGYFAHLAEPSGVEKNDAE